MEIMPILTNLVSYNKIHETNNVTDKITNLNNLSQFHQIEIYSDNKENYEFCNIKCYNCWITNVLSKFFYLLLQIAKFLGTGSYSDPNLIRLSEYYANIFYTYFKSNDISNNSNNEDISYTEIYENYLNYKNKLNYCLIELGLNSETLDEIILYLDNKIIENLSIKLK